MAALGAGTVLITMGAAFLTGTPVGPVAQGSTGPVALTVTPSVASPGQQVTLGVTGCDTAATATSGAFKEVTIPRNGSVSVFVDPKVPRGFAYSVNVLCGDRGASMNLTIRAATSPTPVQPAPATSLTPTQPAPATSPTSAEHGVQAGSGGSFSQLDPRDIAAGAALLAVGVGSLLLVVRSLRRSGRRR